MIRLPLRNTHGDVVSYALIDDVDAHLAARRWWLQLDHGQRYYVIGTGRIKLHRAVLGLDFGDGRLVDHINGDTLDNRRANLRIVTTAQNAQNQGSRGGTSQHRGVSWCTTRQRWAAQAQVAGRKIFLGRFDTEQAAAAAIAAFRAEHMPFSNDALDEEAIAA